MKFFLSAWISCLLLPLAVLADANPASQAAPNAAVEAPARSERGATDKPSAPAAQAEGPKETADSTKDKASPPTAPSQLESTPRASGVNPGGPVVIFPLKTQVDEALLMFMRRAVKEAERKGASAFVIDMDTPGGKVDVTLEILEILHKTNIPTVTFVNPHAISAGAFIALGTKRIYMRPDGTIGAAAIVSGGGEDIGKTMKSKADSFMSAKLRAICLENGHNPDVAEAFMVLEKELKIGDEVIDSKETLLSLNGHEAAKAYNGRPLLAAGLADSIEDVLKAEGLHGQVQRVEPTGFEQVAFWITMLSPLLLIGGIVGGYIEMKAPGFGIPGIISLICFGLFFGGHLVAGLSGYETVFVFAIGLFLVILEIFVIPGTLVAGLVGTVMMLGSLVWAMVDHWPSTPGLPSSADFERPMFNFITALVGTGVLIAILAKLLPKTSIYNRLVLSAADASGPAVTIPLTNLAVKTGDLGEATTTLRPAGKARFGLEVHDVVTNGGYIDAGASVKVVEVDGMRVVVEAAA
jgi:membrane-bound serine protease (ClpP class)